MRAKHIVKVLLFGAVVVATSRDVQAEHIAIKMQTGLRVHHYDGGMVNTEKQPTVARVPFGCPLACGKLQHLKIVTIRVTEIKSLDSAGVRVPVWKALRATRCVFHVEAAQACVGCRHIAHDDRDVLKPAVVAARVERDRSAAWRQELLQFQVLITETHAYRSDA